MGYAVLQDSAQDPLLFFMRASTDHLSGMTGLAPEVVLCKGGGSFAASAGSVSEIAHGWYQVTGHSADTDTPGPLILHAEADGADATERVFYVQADNPHLPVKARVVEALSSDTYAEPGQAIPPTPTTLAYMLSWLYKLSRNKLQQTNTQTSVFNDAGTIVDHKALVSDDGTVTTRAEFVSGP